MPALPTETLDAAAALLRDSKAFARVVVLGADEAGPAVRCDAADCESEAYYLAQPADGVLHVGFYTPDRWLSESVEADLMHTGDKLEELLEEELVDQQVPVTPGQLNIFHYRDDDKRFVFRAEFPTDGDNADAERLTAVVLAFNACFRELGDVVADPEDED